MVRYVFNLVCKDPKCPRELSIECAKIGTHGCNHLRYLPVSSQDTGEVPEEE